MKLTMWLGALLVLCLVHAGLSADDNHATPTTSSDKCHHEEVVSSDVKVATLKLEEVKFPLIFGSFVIITILAKMGWHHPAMHLIASSIPESCMLIFIGTHIGGILIAAFLLDECNEGQVLPFRFTPTLFFVYLLPPIVFASGYFLDNRAFFENIFSILIYAVIGTIWNAFALGFTTYGLSAAGVMDSQFSIASALLFGTICAAVDPVAVLAVFEEIHVNKLLHILVFGESLLNDAVTIVLFQVLGAFSNIPFDTNRTGDEKLEVDIVLAVIQFFVVIIASIVIGFIAGCVASILSRFTAHIHVLEPILIFIIGYMSYLVADLFAFSGIVSLIVCTMIMKHYVPPNIAWKSNITLKYTLKMVSVLSEMIIFLYLGLVLFDISVHNWDTGLIIWTILFATIFRPIGTVVLTLFVNLFRFHKINMKQTFIMSYSGLRGAVAFSLALTRLFEEGVNNLPENELNLRKSMLTATTALLLFTVFVQGTTIKPLVNLIGVRTEKIHKATLNEVIHKTTIDHINSGMQDIAGQFGFNRLWEILHYIDVKYLRKFLERYPEAKDRQIVEKFRNLQFKESRQAADQYYIFDYTTDQQGQEHLIVHPQHDPLLKDDATSTTSSEDCVPALDEVLRASRSHPHEDHFMHVMPREHLETHEHHLQKVKMSHRVKHRTRQARQKRSLLRRHTTLGFNYDHSKDVDDDNVVRDQGLELEPVELVEIQPTTEVELQPIVEEEIQSTAEEEVVLTEDTSSEGTKQTQV